MQRASRSPLAHVLIGVVIGLLVAGLLVPLTFGTSGTAQTAAARGAGPLGPAGSQQQLDAGAAVPGQGAAGNASAAGRQTAGPGASSVSGAAGRAAAGPAARNGAYDQGVTDTSIKVGFLLYDLGGASQAGFTQTGLDPRQQRAAFEAYVDEVNRAGGINGRKIDAVYATYDLLSEDGQRKVCLSMTEDQKVFALVGNFFFRSAYLCATKEHHRVVMALGSTATGPDVYAASAGLLFTAFPEGDRMMSNFAEELRAAGTLNGATVGVLSDDGFDPGEATTRVLEARIKEFGGKVGRHSHLSADLGTASSQVPVEVQQMRSAGVNLVLNAANPILATQFAQLAARQRYLVKYTGSDWAAASSEPGQANMPPEYNGSRTFTGLAVGDSRVGNPETPLDVHCRQVYEAYTHQSLPRDSTPWGVAMGNCNFVRLFALATAKAGSNLTSAGLSQALQSLGPVEVAQWGPGSYRPGKFGFMDSIRPQHWDSGCSCDMTDGPFHPTKY
jgi:ABC-type branched-subunit amino acid transport system substrate-binding protein